jgi:hypothetical protein
MKNWISQIQKLEKKSSDRNFHPSETELANFCTFTDTTYAQGSILAAFILTNGKRRSSTITGIFDRITEHLEPHDMHEAFSDLVMWGYIEIKADDANESDPEIELNHTVDVALRTGQKLLLREHRLQNNPTEQELLHMYAQAVLFLSRNIAFRTWQSYCHTFIRKSRHPLAKKVKRMSGEIPIKSAVLFACLLFLMDWRNINMRWISHLFSPNRIRAKMLYDEWMAPNSLMLTNGLLRLVDGSFGRKILIADLAFARAKTSLQKGEKEGPIHTTPSTLQRIYPKKIKERLLLYNADTALLTHELYQLTQPKSFATFRKKMSKQSEFSGITVLLTGKPGTGKTELARQLARTTGRELLLFNVAEQRDMYYGESEKKIKQLFDYYRSCAENPETAPILCFNEADSIFQRRGSSISNTTQTENTVQTILLNELEVFSGILICTTNLPKMFDDAFSRRFLYRIDIGMPNIETRQRMLEEFFPLLKSEASKKLAEDHSFSAAQLENFKRKHQIASLIKRKPQSLENELGKFLHEEFNNTHKSHRPVMGFKING